MSEGEGRCIYLEDGWEIRQVGERRDLFLYFGGERKATLCRDGVENAVRAIVEKFNLGETILRSSGRFGVEDGDEALVFVADDGEKVPGGRLISFRRDGCLHLETGVDPEVASRAGLQLDGDRRVKLSRSSRQRTFGRAGLVSLELFEDQPRLRLVNEDGENPPDPNLLRIDENGRLRRYPGVNRSFAERAGIALDDSGRIKLAEEGLERPDHGGSVDGFRLERVGGRPCLVIVDEAGNKYGNGHVLTVGSDGTLEFHDGIGERAAEKVGLQRDTARGGPVVHDPCGVRRHDLRLTDDEASALYTVVRSVSGDSGETVREHTDAVKRRLEELGVSELCKFDDRAEGVVTFHPAPRPSFIASLPNLHDELTLVSSEGRRRGRYRYVDAVDARNDTFRLRGDDTWFFRVEDGYTFNGNTGPGRLYAAVPTDDD